MVTGQAACGLFARVAVLAARAFGELRQAAKVRGWRLATERKGRNRARAINFLACLRAVTHLMDIVSMHL